MTIASTGDAGNDRRRQACEWNYREGMTPASSACFLFSAERWPQNVWVGLLARRGRRLSADRFTFPGRIAEWSSKRRPLSQWRDRAGFTPDFPVMPVVGTQTTSRVYITALAPATICAVRPLGVRLWSPLEFR